MSSLGETKGQNRLSEIKGSSEGDGFIRLGGEGADVQTERELGKAVEREAEEEGVEGERCSRRKGRVSCENRPKTVLGAPSPESA